MKKNVSRPLKVSLLRIALVPVVRFCLRRSISLKMFIGVLKEVYVSEATKIISRDGAEVSASRLAIMTGVHRKDVSLIQEGGFDDEARYNDLLTRILGQWQVDREFSSKGRPKTLSCVGKASQFVNLVRKVNKDINPYSALFELERAGLVERGDEGVTAIATEFVPAGNTESVFRMYQEDGSDLLRAVEENAMKVGPTHLHLRTEFDNIPEDKLSEIRKWVFAEGARFHKRARSLLSRYDRDTSNKKDIGRGKARVAVTLFGFSEAIER